MNAFEQIRERAWATPRDYGGFSPIGDYCIGSVHRDSDTISRSNWRCMVRDFGGVDWTPNRDEYQWNGPPAGPHWDARPVCYIWRAGHSAVGWVDYMMIRADAPESVQKEAGEVVAALADYPVYREEDLSDLEWDEACQLWEQSSVADRVEYLQRAGLCIFAARRDSLPDDPAGSLFELLRG